ncbi:D-alanyl-D-alanine carboxypeptidase [Arenibacter nanhaiticus]|uniref:D-alanyl-D-alanine carboxypeptidase n=1 Tax=Arenibacter nanhaiticus TaxID=558155 RepID=A0A1M6H704_9FLAO|nr:M15 family metallopeptidase [Arenibacter nanhaiticus]SHJ17975.1 D-alanyl-D-alanine carboxypeptidase [Arenibacter nanhaiticus]
MHRRSFIKKSSYTGLAMSILPGLSLSKESQYSVLELMGKTSIDLFGTEINLRKEAHDAFLDMKKAAYSDGVDLKIVSSYRNFHRQDAIWEGKYLQFTEQEGMSPPAAIENIIQYSTIPGTSRHHWGTDADIIDGYPRTTGDVLEVEKFEEGGPFAYFKKWMDENATKFGFYLVYTENPKRKGFKYEPWHYSYAPLSVPMLTSFRRKNIFKLLLEEDIIGKENFSSGFLKDYIQNNILSINPELL